MKENKSEICKAFLEVLQMTRQCENLIDLVYIRDGEIEMVIATYSNGFKKICDVTFDSGIAVLKDILKNIG